MLASNMVNVLGGLSVKMTRKFALLGLIMFLVAGCQNISTLSSMRTAEVDESVTFDQEGLPDHWRIQSGIWEVEAGKLTHEGQPHMLGVITRVPEYLGDMTAEVTLHVSSEYPHPEHTWAGWVFSCNPPLLTGHWKDAYFALLRVDGSLQFVDSHSKVVAERATDLDLKQGPVTLRLEVEGNRARLIANGTETLELEADEPFVGGLSLAHFSNTIEVESLSLEGVIVEPQALEVGERIPLQPEAREPVTPLPRIAVNQDPLPRPGFHLAGIDEPFHPEGFNYAVLGKGGWHATFSVGTYDHDELDRNLAEMASVGANVIRVWAWGENVDGEGLTGDVRGSNLNQQYLENFVDFLALANKHKIYVMPILDEIPMNAFYRNIMLNTPEHGEGRISGYTHQFLSQDAIEAKKALIKDFVSYVKRADPGLLNTVLGWQLCNECCVRADEGPFIYKAGTVTVANGKTYDMADFDSRQACWDESIVHWANELSGAVKEVDPDAMVTMGMWTSDAHARVPYNGLVEPEPDPRIPPRPSVLAKDADQLDFLDIHIYPWQNSSEVRPACHEWDEVMATGKPAIVGEYGGFKHDSLEVARQKSLEIREQAYAMGYQGSLFWVWNLCDENHVCYCAHHGDLKHAMAPILQNK